MINTSETSPTIIVKTEEKNNFYIQQKLQESGFKNAKINKSIDGTVNFLNKR